MLRLKEAIRESLRFLLFDNTCSCCHNKVDREGYICSKCLEKLKREAFLKNKDDFYYVFIYEKAIRQIISDYKLRNRKDLARDIAYIIKKPIFQLIEREKNVESAFKNNLNLEDKNVLIVDDIVTSGATIYSISEELRKNNENVNIKVFSIAIARHFIKK